MNSKVLITGSGGFYGSLLSEFLVQNKVECYGIDLVDSPSLPDTNKVVEDICKIDLSEAFSSLRFDVIIHLATQIDFSVASQQSLYKNNIESTSRIIDYAVSSGCPNIIFTSSNSIFLGNEKVFIDDTDVPVPLDMYGKSKLDSESLLLATANKLSINIIRCPIIIDSGRAGMLSILFELLSAGATLWVLDGGTTRHQCIYAQDLNTAIYALLFKNGKNIYNIGCDNVLEFYEIFSNLIKKSNSSSKIRSLPKNMTIFILKQLYKFGLSPMGPYQFRMLTRDFSFDLSKIKSELSWMPTKNNYEVIQLAYDHYRITQNINTNKKSANSSKIKMGILGILKYIRV